MVNKDLSQKSSAYSVLAIVLAVILVCALGLIYWNNSTRKSPTQKYPATQDTRPDIQDILTLGGKVTMKLKSCGAKSLYPDEDVSHYAVCDSGEGVRIDDKIIYTSSGGPQIDGFHVDTDSINLGDDVTARYVVNEHGGASLNCKQCSIVTAKSNNFY